MRTPTRSAISDQLEATISAFEQAYFQDGEADLARYLPAVNHALYRSVLVELVRVDLELSRENGQPRRLEDYQARFPCLLEDHESFQAVAFEEARLWFQAGERFS